MLEYLIFLTIPLFALLRVMDGGWHRLPGSNVILWVAPSVAIYAATMNPWLAAAGVFLGRQWTAGYEDWNDYEEQTIRCWPTAVFAVIALAIDFLGISSINYIGLGIGVGAVVASNVIQPWLRERLAPYGHAANRTAEGLEGGCLALLTIAVA